MDSRKLRYLSAIVEHGSMSQAAMELNISQPALTKSIKSLQDELGVPIFEKKGRHLIPTKYGAALAEHARTIAIETDRAMSKIESLRANATGRINIGVSPSIITSIASTAIALFLAKHPQAMISVREALAEDLFESLLSGQIDLMVSGMPRYLVSNAITREVLLEDTLEAATRNRHPLTKKTRLKLADTLKFGWILPKNNRGVRELLQEAFLTQGLDLPRIIVESDSALFGHSLAANSDSILIISQASLRTLGAPKLTSLQLPGFARQRTIGMIYRDDTAREPLASELMEEIRLTVRKLEAKNNT